MCPDECPGLSDVYGDEFKTLYEGYETANKGRESVNARELWFKMLDAQMETGMPYIVYKDACNKKSNQKNIGIIKSSNLCVAPETQILTDKGHIEIQSLENKTVNVWNGEEFSEVTVRKTGTNQSLIKVEMTDGSFLECTSYHKFWIIRDTYETEVPTNELRVGDITIAYNDSNTGDIVPSKIISNIIDNGRRDNTFCFTEPKRHMGIFNGIITGQCSEVVQYSDSTETAVCNLASIGLPSFVLNDFTFDYEKLHEVAKVVTKNLNKIIDVNYYPTEKTRKSNMRHRPIGIGVQGLADVFMLMNISFLSDAAKKINRDIFETIYHAALESSCEVAEQEGAYETFFETDTAEGSPASQGILQFDLWGVDPGSDRYDWSVLKEKIKRTGLRNSLLLAPMPTASTSQILGFNECIEPITSNIYSRRTLAGEFIQANKYLMADLINAGLWNEKIKNNMIANNGSIQHIDVIPQEIKDKYKTVWELPMRGLIDMAADRGAFICQSQSLNLWLEDPNYSTLTAMHFYSWQKGLKTGIYYLRRRGKHQAQQFTIEPEKAGHANTEEDEICEMCSA
jgi:ribonucleotide reductase alpha subunit